MTQTFGGFSPEAFTFLLELTTTDSKEWFEQHRGQYESQIVEPLTALVGELSDTVLGIDPLIDVAPKVGRTISRIHCDMRFSKRRYRDSAWLTFHRPPGVWADSPEFFFWIGLRNYGYGMGFYSVTNETMARFRGRIANDADEFRRAVSLFSNQTELAVEGESYKRPLPGTVPDDIRPWYQLKRFSLIQSRPIDDRLFQPGLTGDIRKGFGLAAPLYHYLWKCKIGE